jgi:glycosyltransferase involved in cell wall biosynthesis
MSESLRGSDLGIFTVPLNAISWLGASPPYAVFIPVGANLPAAGLREATTSKGRRHALRVAVFGITGGEAGCREAAVIVNALRFVAAKIGRVELNAFGRHADDCESLLREGLRDARVDVQVAGVLPAEEVVRELSASDAMLFVRGAISTRRGSAIAGIACGLPVIAQRGAETSGPIEDAGIAFVSADKPGEIGEALLRVLENPDYREQLAERSRLAHEKYFSWQAIAARYAEELQRTT